MCRQGCVLNKNNKKKNNDNNNNNKKEFCLLFHGTTEIGFGNCARVLAGPT
jgi:hypothetical protein